MAENNFLVAGAANIDIISNIKEKGSNNNHRGPININFGGCGLNMAFNINKLGQNTSFITALGKSDFANLIESKIETAGIKSYIRKVNELPDSMFSGIFNDSGEMITSVLQEVLYTVDIEEEFFELPVANSQGVLLTAELSPKSISNALKCANKHSKKVFIAGCSAEEVNRIDFKNHRIDFLFLNEIETVNFAQSSNFNDLNAFAEHLNTTIIMTQGDKGACIISKDNIQQFNIINKEVNGTTLGAGDYFMSSFAISIINGESIEQAINKTLDTTDLILNQSKANIC